MSLKLNCIFVSDTFISNVPDESSISFLTSPTVFLGIIMLGISSAPAGRSDFIHANL